jgi:hypothetical protein
MDIAARATLAETARWSPGERGNTALVADQGKGDGRDFSGIRVWAGEEGCDLIERPVGTKVTEQLLQVIRL